MAWLLLLLLVIPIGLLYYWLIGTPLLGKGAPFGRTGVIPRKIADSLTGFDEKPAFPPPVGELGDGTALPEAIPAEWEDLVRSMGSRIEKALGDDFAIESDAYGLVLHHGTSSRRVPLAGSFQPPPADRTDRAVRACLKMLEEAQAFRVNELDSRWPVRVTAPGDWPPTTSQPVPRAAVRDGAIHPGYHDDAGIVLELDPIEWPQSTPAT